MFRLDEGNDKSPHRILNGTIMINIIIIIIIIIASAVINFFAAASCCIVTRSNTYCGYAAACLSSSHAPDSSKCPQAECTASISVTKTQLPVRCTVVIKTTQEA